LPPVRTLALMLNPATAASQIFRQVPNDFHMGVKELKIVCPWCSGKQTLPLWALSNCAVRL